MTRILRITLKYKFVKPLDRRSEQHKSAANAYRRRRLPNKKPHHDVAPATNGGERVNTSECSSNHEVLEKTSKHESAARPVCGAQRALKLFSTLSEHFIGNESSTIGNESSIIQNQSILLKDNWLYKNARIFPTFPKSFILPTLPDKTKQFV